MAHTSRAVAGGSPAGRDSAGGGSTGQGSAGRADLGDEIDAALVQELLTDGRATLAHLASIVGLSVSGVQTRVRRLESRGVIRGYRALVDPDVVGTPLAAFIEITPLDPAQIDDAPDQLEHLDEIVACHSVAGQASYMLFVRVASSRRLEALIREIRAAAGVSTRTTVVLQTFYEDRPPHVVAP